MDMAVLSARLARGGAMWLCAAILAACTQRVSTPVTPGALVTEVSPPAATPTRTVVLVALDGVRWQEIYDGVDRALAKKHGMAPGEVIPAAKLVPNLTALRRRGAAMGGPRQSAMVASGPVFVSMPGYLEMLSGRRPTGCTNNECPPTTLRTIADDFAAEPGVDPLDVAVISSWETIGRACASDPSRLTISTGRTQGATRERLRFDAEASVLLAAGEIAGPEPGENDFRRDADTAALALHYLDARTPRFLFLGLGETDEYGHKDDYRGYLRALVFADFVVGAVAQKVDEYERRGIPTTLVVTTDHGRMNDFVKHGAGESNAVWMIASGAGIQRHGGRSAGEAHLADVASTIRAITGVGAIDPSSEPIAEIWDGGEGSSAVAIRR